MLDLLFHRLYRMGHIEAPEMIQDEDGKVLGIEGEGTIETYTFEYQGRLVKQAVTVRPVMKKETLAGIVQRACDGNMADMVTVAMLYNVGFGLPFDETAALAWTRFATLSVALADDFSEYCSRAKLEARDAPNEIWPVSITLPCIRAIDKLGDFAAEKTPSNCFVAPRFKGVRVYLFYTDNPGTVPNLYAGFYVVDKEPKFIAIDKLVDLGAPRYLGEMRNTVTIVDYLPFGPNRMYAIVGTIGIPTSLREQANGVTDEQMLEAFLADTTKELQFEAFCPESHDEELQKLKREEIRLTERIASMDKGSRRAELKNRLDTVKNDIVELQSTAEAKPEVAYRNYLSKRPKFYLRLLMSEMYIWRKKQFYCVPLTPKATQKHLQSLGFKSLTHPQLDFVGFVGDDPTDDELCELAQVFAEYCDMEVEALVMQPLEPNTTVR